MTPLDASQTNPREGGASYPMRHRFIRLAWTMTWLSLVRWSPVPMFGWRRMLLRLFGADIHPTAKIYPSVKIWYPANLKMQAYSCLAPLVNCYCMNMVDIGPYALVSQGAFLCGGTHDIDDPAFQLITKPITLGQNCWIAADAFVGPGVVVGDHAVLGARAVTFRHLEQATVYIGNPAVPMRKRKLSQGVG